MDDSNVPSTIVIAHVLYSFDEVGGLENGVVNLINNLSTNRFKHIICALTRVGDLKNRVRIKDVQYYSLNKHDNNDLSLPISLWKIFRNHHVDVVHLRNWPTMVEGYTAARLANVKNVIYSEHGRHFEDIDEGRKLNTIIKKYIFNHVDLLLAVSKQLGIEMKQVYSLKRDIRVIPNGVDTDKFCPIFKPMIKKQLVLNNDELVVGTVSRLDKVKNLDRFFREAIRNNFSAKILVVGDGPEKDGLEKLVKQLGVRDQIIFLGNRQDIPEIINCMDIFILPSKSEGMSNVVLEAMSCGVPVVAFDVGGNRELIDHDLGGGLVTQNNFDDFFKKLKQLACSPEIRANMGEYNREKVVNSFSIGHMAKAYTALYDGNIDQYVYLSKT